MVPEIAQPDIDAAILRVQLGKATLEDGNLLRAGLDVLLARLESAVAGDDEPTAFERVMGEGGE